jgi:pimeloyl-ACP methyl ester carboxylesterase
MPYVRAQDVNLYYEERAGEEPIVLLHGFTTTHVGNWERSGWIDLLASSGFRVVTLDFRSHGRSDRVHEPSACSTDRLADDVIALLDHLSIPRADLFGFSMGGGVALELAMNVPERVGRVVVAGVADAALNEFHDEQQIAEIRVAFETRSSDEEVSSTGARLRRNAELAGNDVAALAPFLRTGGWPGGIAEPRPVGAPVLLVAAGGDEYMVEVDRILDWLPHAHVLRVPGRTHHTVLGDDDVRTSILAFLQKPGSIDG